MLTGQLRIEPLVRSVYSWVALCDEFPEKPPRIWRRTWKRLIDAVMRWKEIRDEGLFRRIARLIWVSDDERPLS
jgi:hypothetical protein